MSLTRFIPLFNSLSVLSRRLMFARHSSYESDGKTTISILNEEAGSGVMIDSYSQVISHLSTGANLVLSERLRSVLLTRNVCQFGFRLNNGMVVLGPMVVFPRSVLSWNISSVEGITEESLSLFCTLEPKIDILILGVGDSYALTKLNKEVIKFIRKHKINVETLPTEQACTTFNFLNAEHRYVAGAFVPPITLRVTEDDFMQTKLKRKELQNSDLLDP